MAGAATPQAAPDGDVREAAGDEEQGHDLQQPGGQLQRSDRGQGVRADDVAVLDDHGCHQPVAEYDDQQAAGPDGIDEPIPVRRGGCGDPLGDGDWRTTGRHTFSVTTGGLGVRQDRSDQRAEPANLLLHRQG